MLCGDLQGRDREGGSEAQDVGGCGDIRMHMADSLCCTTETRTALGSNCTPIKMYFKKKSFPSSKN